MPVFITQGRYTQDAVEGMLALMILPNWER